MPPAGFELAVPAREQPQTHTLDRAVTGIAPTYIIISFFLPFCFLSDDQLHGFYISDETGRCFGF